MESRKRYNIGYTVETFPHIDSFFACRIKTLLSLSRLSDAGDKVTVYERLLGFLLYRAYRKKNLTKISSFRGLKFPSTRTENSEEGSDDDYISDSGESDYEEDLYAKYSAHSSAVKEEVVKKEEEEVKKEEEPSSPPPGWHSDSHNEKRAQMKETIKSNLQKEAEEAEEEEEEEEEEEGVEKQERDFAAEADSIEHKLYFEAKSFDEYSDMSTFPDRFNAAKPKADVWVQCELCSKWRLLSKNGIEVGELPDVWHCSMNPDKEYNSCDIAEEVIDNGEAEEEEEEEEAGAEAENEYESPHNLSEEELQRIFLKFLAEKRENRSKKRKRAINEAAREEQRKLARVEKEKRELDEFIAKQTEESIAAGRAAAKKRNWKKQIPIHTYPEKYNDVTATRLLLRDIFFGADINAQDHVDRTPLHYAYIFDRPNYADALLKAGAERFACDITSAAPHEYRYEFSKPQTKAQSMFDKFI